MKTIGSHQDLCMFQSLPKTTYQEHSRQIELKPLFDEKDNRRSLFNVETVRVTDIDR